MSKKIIGIVKDWHNPHNEECPHNADPAFNCCCKRPQKRKPYRVVRVKDTENVNHRVNPSLIFEIWPNGALSMREQGRRKRFHIMSGRLYSYLMQREALAYLSQKRAEKAARRKARRQSLALPPRRKTPTNGSSFQ